MHFQRKFRLNIYMKCFAIATVLVITESAFSEYDFHCEESSDFITGKYTVAAKASVQKVVNNYSR